MTANDWKDKMVKLQHEISNSSGYQKQVLKAKFYDAQDNYKKALAEEAKGKYASAGWF